MPPTKEVILNTAFSPDASGLLTVSYDKTAEIWDIEARRRIASIKDHSDTVQCVAFDRDGKTLATGGMDRIVKLSDGVTGKGFLTINPELKGILTLAFSPDGKFLVTSGESPEIRWWDLGNMSEIRRAERGWIPARKMAGHNGSVADLRFSPDGHTLAQRGGRPNCPPVQDASSRPSSPNIGSTPTICSIRSPSAPIRSGSAAAGGAWADASLGCQDRFWLLDRSRSDQDGSLSRYGRTEGYSVSANWKDLVRPQEVAHAKNN